MMTIKKSRHSRHTVNFKDIDQNSTSNDNDDKETNTKQKKLDPFPNDSKFNTNFIIYTDISHNTDTILNSNVLANFDCPIIFQNATSDDGANEKNISSAMKVHETVVINKNKSEIFKKPTIGQNKKCINSTTNKKEQPSKILGTQNTHFSNDNKWLPSEILRKLNKLIQEVRIIKENITEIKESLNNGPNNKLDSAGLRITNPELINGKKIYIETLTWTTDDMDKMETELEDAEFFEKVGTTLCRIDGDNVKAITHNVLFQVLSNKIAAEFSWAGIREKKGFKDLNITKLVRVVVHSQRPEASETEIDNIIGKWLVQAPLRCKREIVKNNKSMSNSTIIKDNKNKDA